MRNQLGSPKKFLIILLFVLPFQLSGQMMRSIPIYDEFGIDSLATT
jgi:hypothetical protein